MKNSLLAIFDEIPCTIYIYIYIQGLWRLTLEELDGKHIPPLKKEIINNNYHTTHTWSQMVTYMRDGVC